ncbi:MAG: TIM barrel protein [Bryobacteraceae bacterium]|nr:TIM barrel protein [Bryobacteraceae bacterium]
MARRTFLAASGAALAGSGLQQASKKPRITASVMLWTLRGTFEQRLETAAKAGLESVELVAEHVQWSDADIERVKKLARSLGLGMDTIIATPNWANRPVSMVNPEHRENFLNDVRQAITFAQKLEIPQIILMSGNEIPGRTREEQWASLVEGAKRAGDLAAKANLTLIVEPLNNKVNHKGFFLTTCVDGLRLIREVDHPHVRLLFDIYHEQVQIGNVIRTITEAAPYVSVFHIADNPGRNDPGTGELNYANIYKAIRKTGYSGYITMEYLPLGDPVESLTKAVKDMRAAFVA